MKKENLLRELHMVSEKYKESEVPVVCLNHVVELYYYEYYVNQKEYVLGEVNLNQKYRELAEAYAGEENWEQAGQAYEQAFIWNPVDVDALFGWMDALKMQEKLEDMLTLNKKAYVFLNSRATLARYYRNYGYYFLETYQPENAAMLYQFSNLFYHTKQADHEIQFLEDAMKKPYEERSVEELAEVLQKLEIPIHADNKTVALTYQAGKEEEANGRFDTAKECYLMVYDLTFDEEVKHKIIAMP